MSQLKLQEKKNDLEILNSSEVSFWIDSSGGPSQLCNMSMISANPRYVIHGFLSEVNCFDLLEEKIKKEKDGIFVGYISYDLFQRKNTQEASYPDFFFAYFDEVIASEAPTLRSGQAPQSRSLEEVSIGIASVATLPRNDILKSNMTDNEFMEKVKLIKEEIKKGNVYQVNLTREYSLRRDAINGVSTDDIDLYLKLRHASPNPYGCFFKTPFVTILSSSPEEFLYIKDGYIRTRPIKGTLPRDTFKIDPKNQAENIMIVDLERNDLGRICKTGSIKAKRLLEIESYKHLNHVVSTVEGKLKEDTSLKQIFEAVFPGGSITGAPKIAAMKIINKIEPTKRGAYTGCFGYIKPDGTMNFNILIRTIFIKHNVIASERSERSNPDRISSGTASSLSAPRSDNCQIVTFNVGGGIVADSDPESELEEIKLKAKGIMEALHC